MLIMRLEGCLMFWETSGLQNLPLWCSWVTTGGSWENCEWCKKTNFEVAAHAPLILHVPGLTDQGLRSSQLVEFVDIFPTLADAAGFNPLEPCPELSNTSLLCTEGSSLIPLLEDPNDS